MIKSIRKLFRIGAKSPGNSATPPEVPNGPLHGWSERPVIRLGQLRRNEGMVAQVRVALGTPGGVLLMDVLQSESLSNFQTPGGLAPHDLIKHLGQCEGYRIALNNIRAMTTPIEDQKIVSETYGYDDQTPYPPRPSR